MSKHQKPLPEPAMHAPMQMASGRVVDLANLRATDIHWPDLVESLVKLPRFNGATPHITYTTAQHCVLMHDRAEDLYKPQALLADFHAAYFGEISQSFRHFAAILSGDPGEFLEAFRLAREEITSVIYEAAGIAEEDDTAKYRDRASHVAVIDKMLTASEQRDLMAPCRKPDHWQLPTPFPLPVKAWGEDKARAELEMRLKLIGILVRG